MTEQQNQMITPILETIQDDEIRTFAYVLVDNLPDYIWHVGASSTGKYHPAYSLGECGLMRHQIAVVRFLNFFFELEQYNTKFTSREMDLMRVAGLVHDGRKSGEQSDYERSKFTKFDHPMQMANVIRSYDGQFLNHEDIEFIAHCIESHMGQWNTDRKSQMVLPKPMNEYQYFVHLADYLASRKDLTMAFDEIVQPKPKPVDINTYTMKSGTFAGKTILEIARIRPSWLDWALENHPSQIVKDLIKQYRKTHVEDDEI